MIVRSLMGPSSSVIRPQRKEKNAPGGERFGYQRVPETIQGVVAFCWIKNG